MIEHLTDFFRHLPHHVQHFFSMGGYGWTVWPCFVLVLSGLLVSALVPWFKHRQQLKRLNAQMRVSGLSNRPTGKGINA